MDSAIARQQPRLVLVWRGYAREYLLLRYRPTAGANEKTRTIGRVRPWPGEESAMKTIATLVENAGRLTLEELLMIRVVLARKERKA